MLNLKSMVYFLHHIDPKRLNGKKSQNTNKI
jgi:hypothetical protein